MLALRGAVVVLLPWWWLPAGEDDRWRYAGLPSEAECQQRYHEAVRDLAEAGGMARAHAQFRKDFWWAAWWVTWTGTVACDGERACPETRAKYAARMETMIGAAAFREGRWPLPGGVREMPR